MACTTLQRCMVLNIYYLKEQTKVEGHGFTLQVTGLRGDHYRNMSLEFYVLSVIYQEKACVNHSFLSNLTIQNTIKQKKKRKLKASSRYLYSIHLRSRLCSITSLQ